MARGKKYDVSGLPEAQFEPGSRGRVLKNLLGIKNQSEMDRLEAVALKQAEEVFFSMYDQGHCFTADDICRMHKIWLGKIYSWAGNYRQVNISKGSFDFAAAAHIPQLMNTFEHDHLSVYTPCSFKDQKQVVRALSDVHVELILIHPFREGNGRIARLLTILMALQAGLPPLNFSIITGKKKEEYFTAVRAGMKRDYMPMEEIFGEVLESTISGREDKK